MSGSGPPSSSNADNYRTPKATLTQTLRYLWPYIWDFKGHVTLATVTLFVAKGAILLTPWDLKHITMVSMRV